MIYRASTPGISTDKRKVLDEVARQEQLNRIIPENTEFSKKISYKAPGVKTMEIKNPLNKKPVKIEKYEGPGKAEYTVKSWDKDKIVLEITSDGDVDFTLHG